MMSSKASLFSRFNKMTHDLPPGYSSMLVELGPVHMFLFPGVLSHGPTANAAMVSAMAK